LIIKVLFLTET